MDDNNTSAGNTETRKETERFEDLIGKMFSKCTEERGCQLLLEKLRERKLEGIEIIFSELKDCIPKLMFNPHGSAVILRLFEVSDEEQKNQFLSSVVSDARLLISVCVDPQGSRTMQKLIGFPMGEEQISRIMGFLSYFVVPLANHPTGCQIVAHCFKIFPVPAKETELLLDTITEFCLELAVDENGSNLLKILLSEHGSDELYIVQSILENINYLSRDEFGASLVQHLIGLLKPKQLQDLVDEMKGIFVDLCLHIYVRDVVKKLIGSSRAKFAPQIISAMIKDHGLLHVLLDPVACSSRAKFAPQIISAMIKDHGLLHVLLDPCGFSILKSAEKYAEGTDRKTLNDLICRCSQLLMD